MLQLHDVIVRYGGITAVKGINLNVEDKEIVAIIGPNGAGKTTILMAISGIASVYQGSIMFQGENIAEKSSDSIVKSGIIHVPEGRMIFSDMTVYENLLMGAFSQRYDYGQLHGQIEMVNLLFPILKERERQLAGSLSGGEQQMLSIARGLVVDPKLFMLDEPSLGLAPIIISEIFRKLQKLNEQGLTILLVEQNAKKALGVADRAYVLESGLTKFEGKATELLGNPDIKKAYLG